MSTIPTCTKVTVWNTATTTLAAHDWRQILSLQNDADEDIYFAFWQDAVMNSWMKLSAWEWLIWESSDYPFIKNSVSSICSSWSKNLLITTL